MKKLQTVTASVKPWYESATIWFNIISLVVVFLQEFTDLHIIDQFITNPFQAQHVTDWIIGLVAVMNIVLRIFKTKQPVSLS